MSDEWAKKVTVDDHVFDSVLEADWYVTLRSWGLLVTPHPGSVILDDATEWQPDFLVRDWTGASVLCEAKGMHNERLWKAAKACEQNPDAGGVIVLRPGFVPAGSDVETAGAVWHDALTWGKTWVVAFDEEGLARFTCDGPNDGETVRVSAEQTLVRPDVEGLEMVKAVR